MSLWCFVGQYLNASRGFHKMAGPDLTIIITRGNWAGFVKDGQSLCIVGGRSIFQSGVEQVGPPGHRVRVGLELQVVQA